MGEARTEVGEEKDRRTYRGFSREQEEVVRSLINNAPLRCYVDEVTFRRTLDSTRVAEVKSTNRLVYTPERLVLYPKFFSLDRNSQQAVITHELAHMNSPFKSYIPNGDRVEGVIQKVVRQCRATGVYLNNYHRRVVEAYDRKWLKDAKAEEKMNDETFAILVQLRIHSTVDLKGKDELLQAKTSSGYQPLFSHSSVPEGIDIALMQLLVPRPKSVEELNIQINSMAQADPNLGIPDRSLKNQALPL